MNTELHPQPKTSNPKTEHSTTQSAQELEFQQRRLALFGQVSASLSALYFVIKAVVAVGIYHQPDALLRPSFSYHAIGTIGFALIWVMSRGKTARSRHYLRAVEIIGLAIGCTAFSALALGVPTLGSPSFMLILILTYVFITRATLVPSTPLRTALLTLVAGAPLLVFGYEQIVTSAELIEFVIASRPEGGAFAREYFGTDAASLAVSETIFSGVWWLVTTAIATITSRVVYGLRREIREAKKLGQYTLREKLGDGGMGVVFRAEHLLLRRPTAVKLLLPERAGETNILRFEREVQLTSKLTHPNTVTVFDYGRTSDGIFYYAMELLEGCTLERLLELDGPQPPGRVVHVLRQVASALVEAHGIGLIHRDIKPANIILCARGGMFDVVKIVDFGLVKPMHESSDTNVTRQNVITGTPLYMSPETITTPASIDGRSDLYSLGAVGYFLLTGQHVFGGRTPAEVCSHHLHTAPVRPSERTSRELPEQLEALILDCLAKSPDERPASAGALVDRLDALTGVVPWTKEDAERWWTENGTRARAFSEPSEASKESSTFAVDRWREAA